GRELAERAGDAVRTAPAIGFVCGVQTMTGKTDEAIAHGEDALQRWVPGTRGSDFATLKEFLADCYYWAGRYADAEEFARAAHELGGTTHNVNALMRGGGWRGGALAGMGRTGESMALLERLIGAADRIGGPRFAAPALNYSTQNFRDLYVLDEHGAGTSEPSRWSGGRASTGCPGCRDRSTC